MIPMAEELGDFIEASGLLEYDPKAITDIYKGHPLRLLRRLWQTLVPLGLFLFGVGIDKILGHLNNKNRARERAKEFTDLLVQLGPAFINAGPSSTRRRVNSFALAFVLSGSSSSPIHLSTAKPNKNKLNGRSVCQSLFSSRFGFPR